MWGTIIGFLGKFSIKQYIYGAIAIAALTLGLKVWNGVQAHFAEVANLREAHTELTIQNQTLINNKAQQDIVINSLQTALETQAEAINIVNEEMGQARQEAEKQKRVLEGSRLGRLAAERAGRIEDLSNTATEDRRSSIEEIINEDF